MVEALWNHSVTSDGGPVRTLTIKGVPDELYERLKQTAAANRRSINSEAIVCLERSLHRPPKDPEAILARVRALRERLNVPPLTDEFLEKAKSWGRP